MVTAGLDHAAALRRADDFARRTVHELRVVARDAITRLDPVAPSDHDLIAVRARWAEAVDRNLLPVVQREWLFAASAIWKQLADVTEAGWPTLTAPAEAYVAASRVWLVDLGGHLLIALSDALSDVADGDAKIVLTTAATRVEPRAASVARTTSMGASNAGAYSQVVASNLPGEKRWVTVGDADVRPSHRELHGEVVGLRDPFEVDGAAMSGPYDPLGPVAESISCRCVLAFSVEPLGQLTAAATDEPTGAMIALVPSDADAARLAQDGGEPVDQLHLTLWFLGDASAYSAEDRATINGSVAASIDQMEPGALTANAFGVGYWNPTSEDPAWVLNIGDAENGQLTGLRAMLGVDAPDAPEQHSPWSPHVCVAYSTDPAWVEKLAGLLGPITFDRVRVAFGSDVLDVTLE